MSSEEPRAPKFTSYSTFGQSQKKISADIDMRCLILKNTEPEASIHSGDVGYHIVCCTITNNDRFVVLGLANGEIVAIDLENENQKHTLQGHQEIVKSVCATSDSKFLVSGSYDRQVIIWTFNDATNFRPLLGHKDKVLSVSISADNKWIASSGMDKKVLLWSRRKGILRQTVDLGHAIAYAVCITKDKSRLVLGCSDSNLIVWSLQENAELATCRGHEMPVTSLCLSSDDSFAVSSSMDNSVRLWDVNLFQQQGVIKRKEESVNAVSLTSDDKYVAYCCFDGSVSLSEVRSFRSGQTFDWKVHTDSVRCVKLSRSGRYLLSGSNDQTYKLIRLSESPREEFLAGHERGIHHLEFSPDSKYLLSASDDNNILVWRIGSADCEYLLDGHTDSVNCLSVSPNGKYCVSGSSDKTVRVWNIAEEHSLHCLTYHSESVTCISYSRDGSRIYSGSADMTVVVWDVELEAVIETLSCNGQLKTLCCSSSHLFLSAHEKEISMLSLENFVLEHQFVGHKAQVSCLTVTGDQSSLISCGHDGTIRLWDLRIKSCMAVLRCPEANINKVMVTSDSAYLFSVSNGSTMRLWSLDSKVGFGVLYEKKMMYACAVSYTNDFIAFSSESTIVLANSPLMGIEMQRFSVLPYKYSYVFKSLLYSLLNGKQPEFDPYFANAIIVPWNLNLMHILTYMNYSNLLKDCIYAQGKFLKAAGGETPLKIALSRESTMCAGLLIESFPTHLVKSHPYSIEFVRDDLELLNQSSLHSLELLYKCLFVRVTHPSLQTYGTLLSKAPRILTSPTKMIDPRQFLVENAQGNALFESEIEFKHSLVPINLGLGSIESIEFFRSLSGCKNLNIFETDFIQSLLTFKWRQILWIIWAQTLLYVLLLFILLYYCLSDLSSVAPLVLLSLLNTVFLAYEIVQMIGEKIAYFKSPLNFLDCVRIIVLYIYALMVQAEVEEHNLIIVLSGLVIICWIRLIAYTRMFDGARYLVRMVTEVIKDMGPFFLLFITSTVAFAIGFFVAAEGEMSFLDSVLHSYTLAYGDFSTDHYNSLEILLFFWATLLNALILLNMLIAIMSDTFTRVRQLVRVVDLREMTEIILEIDNVCFWGRQKGERKYLHECSFPQSNQIVKTKDVASVTLESLEQLSDEINNKLEGIGSALKGIKKRMNQTNHHEIMSLIRQISGEVESFHALPQLRSNKSL